MEVEERLEMSRVLLDELERLTGQLTPNNKELPEIIEKSLHVESKNEPVLCSIPTRGISGSNGIARFSYKTTERTKQ